MAKTAEWKEYGTIGHASDLVGTALTLGQVDGEVKAAAKLLMEGEGNVATWAQELAGIALGVRSIEGGIPLAQRAEQRLKDASLYAQVRTFRTLLTQEPRDPVTWVDLAFAYACLGLRDRAAKAMMVAMQLSKDNRFVLRSAGRLWIYLDDPERAYQVVARSRRTKYDPWLLAAEIALGSVVGKGRRHAKHGRRMLGGGQFEAKQVSELASALATLELSSGSVRKGKRLLALSLEDPTENSVAQAIWAARRYRSVHFDPQQLRRQSAFEAASLASYQDEEWHHVLDNTRRWFGDQPFSSRPAGLGSFVSTTALTDYSTGKWFAAMGLRANPGDFTLLNNLAFACLQLDDVAGAAVALERIDRSSLSMEQSIVLQATQGLMEFRTGHPDQGRQLYEAARTSAKRLGNQNGQRIHALASMFFALEELSVGGPNVDVICGDALTSAARASDPIVAPLERRVRKKWRTKDDKHGSSG